MLANDKVSNHSFDQIHVSHYFRCQGYQHEDAKIDYFVYCKAATHRDITMLLAKTRGQLFFDITKARGMLVRPDLSTVSSARYVDRASRMTGRQCSALFVLDHAQILRGYAG